MRRLGALSAIAASLCWIAVVVAPQTASQDVGAARRGRQIAEEAERRDRGYGDEQVDLEMILRDRRGQETRRQLVASVLEGEGGEDRSLVVFESPRDIRGTALLTHSHADRDDEQWLYLPALRRTKRIAPANRSSPFMGSELAYEDLAETDIEDFEYRFIRNDTLRDNACFVVELHPRYEGTGYLRQQVWLDQAEYRVLQIDYWDLRNRRLKTLSFGAYRQYLDRYWRPMRARVVNHQTNDVTLLVWRNYRFRTGLTESDFSRNALRRAR